MRRGRPRDSRVPDRDEVIRKMVVEEGPLSRNFIRDRLGLTDSLTWLSLNRLRNQGLIEKCRDQSYDVMWSRPGWTRDVS